MSMSSTDRTRNHVEQMMKGTLASLAIAARGIETGMDVPDDEHDLVARGDGNDASTYLRELVLEEKTPKHARCTDFMLTIGGPTIWLRNYARDDRFVLYGDSAGLDEPIHWPITEDEHPDAYKACELLMDFDFMDLGIDPAPSEFDAHDDLIEEDA